jgi:hypothetical protein
MNNKKIVVVSAISVATFLVLAAAILPTLAHDAFAKRITVVRKDCCANNRQTIIGDPSGNTFVNNPQSSQTQTVTTVTPDS